ncbi:MAG: RluA family pseudouridine synthase [Candidatus Falkowbacteria bacterium]|nr:RluA family pseudouridine synthase [Candidatus Falkowbacteria bacterium]
MKTIIYKETDKPRIDKFLASNLDLSRSKIQKLIIDEFVVVNDKEVTPHYDLKEGDVIKIKTETKKNMDVEMAADNIKKEAQDRIKLNIKIIKEDPDYLIVDKPAGLAVHGAEHMNEVTLIDYLVEKYPDIVGVGDDEKRPGIVHRIDKDVSGLLVVARNNKIYEHLKSQFKKRTIKKEYEALVYGATSKDYDTIDFPLRRSTSGYKISALPKGSEIKDDIREAITLFEVKQRFINYTLLNVIIKTGRTHQIRCHLAAYGHPIVGDELYSTKKTREKNKKLKLGRIFLCSVRLGFKDLNGEKVEFKANLPKNLKDVLDKVK